MHLSTDDRPTQDSNPGSCPLTLETPDVPCTLAEAEKRHIYATLRYTGGRKNRAAAILDIDRRTLYRKLAQYEQEKRH